MNDVSFTFMPRDSTELEKMSLAELIIHLAMEGYKINFRKLENDKDDYGTLVIELLKEFLGKCYVKKIFIDRVICDMVNLSCEYILKSDILRAVSEFDKLYTDNSQIFDKYDEIKKKVTT